jgi:hypothetical protein
MSERFLLLERRIEEDLATIERLYAELGEPELRGDEPQETLIVVAYRLHQLYNAFENIFRNVAASVAEEPGRLAAAVPAAGPV